MQPKHIIIRRHFVVCLLALFFAGCEKPAFIRSPLPTIQIGSKTLAVEIADTPEKSVTGLMFRKELPPEQGMLFVFETPRQASFWMRNTTLPLSIAYLDQSGRITEIHDLHPLDETPVRSRHPNIAYALEVNRGWFEKNAIKAGDTALIPTLPPAR